MSSGVWPALANTAAGATAHVIRLRPAVAVRPATPAASSFLPYDWQALVTRFVFEDGVDYATFARVLRILEVHLDRISEARPDTFRASDERLAFYLNAYNAIAVYQVIAHYPIRSIRDVPNAFTRPFPVGHENLSLSLLFHSRIRAFGDPRVHAAVVPATTSAPRLRAYTAGNLHQELDDQLRELLAARRGARPMPHGTGVILNPIFREYAADFINPGSTPGGLRLLAGRLRPRRVLHALDDYLPPTLRSFVDHPEARVAFLTYDWTLNERTSSSAT